MIVPRLRKQCVHDIRKDNDEVGFFDRVIRKVFYDPIFDPTFQ